MFVRKQISRIFSLVLLFTVIIGFSIPARADDSTRRIVKVGYFPFDGYHFMDENGNRSGYGYEYLQNMLNFANWDYRYIGYNENKSWSDMLDMLENGQIDMLTSAVKTPEREAKFAFSDKPIGTSNTIFTVKAGNTKYTDSDYSVWNGMKVGMLEKSSRNDSFDAFSKQNGFTYIPVYFKTDNELVSNLEAGSIDAIVTSDLRKIENEWLLARFDPKPFYVLVRKDDKELLNEVNYAIEQVESVMPDLQTTLHRKYYSPKNGSEIAFTQQEAEFIRKSVKQGKTFKAIIDPDQRPYAYYKDGKMEGILSDICREIFSRTGLSIEMLPVRDKDEYQKLRQDTSVSICCDFSSDSSKAEDLGYVLTSPYYSSSIARLYRKNFSGNAKTVGIVKESIIDELRIKDDASLINYDNVSDCAKAVKDGKIDTCYLFTNTAQAMVWEDSTNQLNCVTLPRTGMEFSIGVQKKEDYLLTSVINKALISISDEDVTAIASPYTVNRVKTQTLTGLLYDQPMVVALGIAVALFILFLIVIAVILHRKQVSEAKANTALSEAVVAANAAAKAKSNFLSRISHDIRTPLNVINSKTVFAIEDMDDRDKLKKDISDIQTSSSFLLSLINDILDISKIDSGTMELHLQPYSYNEYMSTMKSMFEPLCRQKGIVFETGGNACPLILTDPVRLNQLTLNLISNAIKYTPKGGKVIFLASSKADENGMLECEIHVKDNGRGMSSEFQKIMFEPFTREAVSESALLSEQGTGLGLSIVKRITELFGGTIGVESEKGVGTDISVKFKCQKADEKADDKIIKTTKECIPEGSTLLVAEDHPMNAEITERLLKSFGLNCVLAENGEAAVKLFENSKPGEFSAILMDIQMPLMNGYEATKKIRMLNRTDAKTIPIIAMTADAYDEDVKRCINCGMNGHVSKPVDAKMLKEKLDELCRR